MAGKGRAIVFEATDDTLLDVVQNKLEAEGLQPRRLGRTNAALMGGGNAAFPQLIDVPVEHRALALRLIAAEASGPADDLEAQALGAPRAELTEVAGVETAPAQDDAAAKLPATDRSRTSPGHRALRVLVGIGLGGFLALMLAALWSVMLSSLGVRASVDAAGFAVVAGAAMGASERSWRHPWVAASALVGVLAAVHLLAQ